MTMTEQVLRDRIGANLEPVLKGLRFYDYNKDGKVTRQDLRKVLESYCFKLTDQQFDKYLLRYNFHHNGLVNYQDFLRQLGVVVSHNSSIRPTTASAISTLDCSEVTGHNKGTANLMKRSRQNDEILVQSWNEDQIEFEFRKRMRTNYLKLKKAFMAFDKHKEGCVSIDDLKSILRNFTLPMSDQVFMHLMERCGVKASGHVAWEIFLEKFQNPMAVGNGQTLPIRSNYRIHPAAETKTIFDWKTLWKELYKRVHSHFNSLKEAFLQMDKNRNGRLARREFRELIEKFAFRLDDGQFNELMLMIDPDRSNKVDYHTFLRLFEDKETKEGHKWLNSVHKYNNVSKPPRLSWETVEELLREKITYYWKNVSDWLKHYDSGDTGYLSKSTLRKVIDLQVLPVTDEHFESLINKCTDFKGGKVNYMEFIERLGVDVSPGDSTGLSTQIIDGSTRAEIRRQCDQTYRHDQLTTNQHNRSSHMTAGEVITLFKDKMEQLTPALRQAFLKNDRRKKGQINKKQFRQILADLGIFLSDEQFLELVSKLDLHKGHMQYMDWVNNFGPPWHKDGSTGILNHLHNHRVDPIRGDEHDVAATEAEARLRQKLRENFSNLRDAFYKFDDLHIGCLNKSSFRRMLDSFRIITSNEEYEKLCENLGIMKDSVISYLDFLERFELRELPEGHKWLSSVHRFNNTYKPKPLGASEALALLATKAHRQWNDLSEAFRTMSSKGNGSITKQQLRRTLDRFLIPVEPSEFKVLWTKLDSDNKNYISHQDFLQRLGAPEYAPGDNGPSSSIHKGNYYFLKNHSQTQQQKHEDITWNQANLAMNMSVTEVERILRDKIRDNFSDLHTSFRKYDASKLGVLSMADIQKVLNEQHIFINDQQFFSLMNRIGLPSYGSRINYTEFLNAFEDGRKSSYGPPIRDIKIEKYQTMSLEDAETKLKMKLIANIDDVSKALAAFDKAGEGKVLLPDFRRVLDMFCFALTDAQWKHIKTGLSITDNQCVEYNYFLSQFVTKEPDNSGEYTHFPQDASSLTPAIDDEVAERIHKAVFSHYHNMLREFESLDSAKLGSVTTDELRDVIAMHTIDLSDKQFQQLTAVCPTNELNKVDYKQFMKMFSECTPLTDQTTLPTTTEQAPNQMQSIGPTRPYTSRTHRTTSRRSSCYSSCMSRSSLRSRSRMSTPMINAESAERQVKDAVFQHWHKMQKLCREMDVDNSRTVSIQQFNDLLSQFGVVLPPSDLNNLLMKYDIFENGRFCYGDFLKYLLLTVKPGQNKTLMTREKMPNSRIQNSESPIQEVEETIDFQRRTLDCVQHCWKEMRREFRAADPESQGTVLTDDFRRILRKFNVNISESEFHVLQDKYDKYFSDEISYNDFLKDYLHRVSK